MGAEALLRVWFLGYLKQGDPISPLSILNRVFFFLYPIRFEQRMNFDRVRTAYIVPFTFTCNPLLAQINLNLKENRLL